jgi:hypothetical protein
MWSGVILLGLLGVLPSVLSRLVEHRVLDGNPGSRAGRRGEVIGSFLPGYRDQLTTRGDHRYTELHGRVYAQIQKAKQEGRTR